MFLVGFAGVLFLGEFGGFWRAVALYTALFKDSALSVRSQVISGSAFPKWP
jgi:hypothetical protein